MRIDQQRLAAAELRSFTGNGDVRTRRRPSRLAARCLTLGWLALVLVLAGCAHPAGSRRHASHQIPSSPVAWSAAEANGIHSLREELLALSTSVATNEARSVAACAYEQSRQLAKDYRLARPPLFHNFLVNLRVKQRGLCYHWAEDLASRFRALNLNTLAVRWAIARAGTVREHNALVITASGQPFEQGIVLDAWRRSGRLTWTRVQSDRYPWEEGELDPEPSDSPRALR